MDELSESKCKKIAVTGDQCKIDRLEDSPFCEVHKIEAEGKIRRTRAMAEKREEAAEELLDTVHEIETRRDVQKLLKQTINGILHGTLKRDKAGMLGLFIPLAWKIAKELEGTGHAGQTPQSTRITNIINVNNTNNTLEVGMSDKELDRYLVGDEVVKVSMLENLHAAGQIIKTPKDQEQLQTIKAREIKDENIKMSPALLAEISKGTEAEMTKQDAIDIFGSVLGDTEGKGIMGHDERPALVAGFDHLWEKNGLPEEVPDLRHDYVNEYEDLGDGFQKRWNVCTLCGRKIANKGDNQLCPVKMKAGKKSRSKTTSTG